MENMDEPKFENQWREALDGAEVTPSPKVWENVELKLLKTENATMQKRIVLYQRLAAASVAILLMAGGWYSFFGAQGSEAELLAGKANSNTELKTNTGSPQSEESATPTTTTQTGSQGVVEEKENDTNALKLNLQAGNSGNSQKTGAPVHQAEITNNSLITNELIADKENSKPDFFDRFFREYKSKSALPTVAVSSVLPEINQLKAQDPNALPSYLPTAWVEPETKKARKGKSSKRNTWTSFGMAGGLLASAANNNALYSANAPNFKSFSPKSELLSTKDDVQQGIATSITLAGGKRIGNRFNIQGGISYLNQQYATNSESLSIGLLNDIDPGATALNGEQVVTTSSTNEFKNQIQFMSMPVMLGYMIVDKKFGLQVNAGIAPDFFLKSTINNRSEDTETVISGQNDSFNRMSVAGLGGLELSYALSRRYRISLNPGVRYSLTSVYKDKTLSSTKPLVADVGLRVQYLFE